MSIYLCYFMFRGSEQEVQIDWMRQVTAGFWVNCEGDFTTGEDCLYWIPPNRIEYIEKVNTEEKP